MKTTLTIEESARLIELGVDAKLASNDKVTYDKKTQDLAGACLPKEAREKIRKDYSLYNSSYSVDFNDGYGEALNTYFGSHNLTTDTEPEEMLMVERKTITDIYEANERIIDSPQWTKGRKDMSSHVNSLFETIFGDKCLPDKESGQSNLCDTCSNELKDSPDCSYFDSCGIKSCSDYKSKEQPRPKFKVGDKVIVIDNIRAIYTDPMTIKGVSLAEDGKYCYNVIEYGIKFHEDNLEPYTEPIAQNPAENSNTGSLSSKSRRK